jgi:hypothetical protein
VSRSPVIYFCGAVLLGSPNRADLIELIHVTLDRAKSNPLHNGGRMLGDVLRSYIFGGARSPYFSLQRKILNHTEWNISMSEGSSVAYAVLLRYVYSSNWPDRDSADWESWTPLEPAPHAHGSERGFLHRRSQIVRLLVQKIISEHRCLNLRDDSKEIANTVCHVHGSIEDCLIGASRLKGLLRLSINRTLVRKAVVRDVICMMEFGRIYDVQDENANLLLTKTNILSWAEEWEVLDLWVQALCQAGINVPKLTRQTWRSQRSLYDYSQ